MEIFRDAKEENNLDLVFGNDGIVKQLLLISLAYLINANYAAACLAYPRTI